MSFSKRMKQSREKQGITLAELGRKIGKTEATVQRYESGNIKNLKNDTIENIASALNVNPAYLMGWINEEPSNEDTIAAHLDGDDFTEEELAEIRKYANYVREQHRKMQGE
ncbi:repressor [Staphylococcus equorum]|uniref:helix-turn-helix domain-containing protein n=1 Tax=Staphylococcus equorum TaxID=246432 RepID=UPI000852A66B|nr:helix-turn-helix transcriptional regulator [Staphylococcus equorum]OEK54329.1 repressor [Staphylococcus equorum]